MRSHFFLLLGVFLVMSKVSFSQNVYTFTGNGSWKIANNWNDNKLPPNILPVGDSIIIDPAGSGECILDTIQIISKGAFFTVRYGKKFTVLGNLSQTGSLENGDSTFMDYRDYQVYTFRHIGTQVWMTKNLNYAAPGSLCYDDDAANCNIYGRLYEWKTALTVAPPGWHLPSDEEWSTLVNFLGGGSVAGGAMKDTTLWASPNTEATNSSGFSALPGGYHDYTQYYGIGVFGLWWSATPIAMGQYIYGWNRTLMHDTGQARRFYGPGEFYWSSVRCVRD